MGVSKNRGVSPQIIHFNRVFHEINHPFWGTTIIGNTHIYLSITVYIYLGNLRNLSVSDPYLFDTKMFFCGDDSGKRCFNPKTPNPPGSLQPQPGRISWSIKIVR